MLDSLDETRGLFVCEFWLVMSSDVPSAKEKKEFCAARISSETCRAAGGSGGGR